MDKKLLLSVLKQAKNYTVSPKKYKGLEILKSFHITVNSGKMKIEATTLEQYFICEIPTELQDMNIFPYAKTLVDLIDVMDDGNISIEYHPTYLPKQWLVKYQGGSDEIENIPCVVISQGKSTFRLMAFGQRSHYNRFRQFKEENYPIPTQEDLKNSKLYEKDEIHIKGTGVVAYVYSLPKHDNDGCNYGAMRKNEEGDIYNTFPKYLKIAGLIYQKGKLQQDYVFSKGKHSYKHYCSYNSYNSEIRVFADEIENYELA